MPPLYDVFLSYSSADKPVVEAIARKLREARVEPFLDKWHLIPGEPWQEALEEALGESATCAVFLGPAGIGPWQNEEMRAALDERVQNGDFRVIPVLLPRARKPGRKDLPTFLRRLTWVEFQGVEDGEALHLLICGVRGQAPGLSREARTPPGIPNFRSMVPKPDGFIHRKEYDQVVGALCAENPHGSAVGITTALRGAGGFGKTALAQAVCQDERVRQMYPDGILWTTMGLDIDANGRLACIRDLIRWWTDEEPPAFETVDAAGAYLRRLLERRRVLLVVDDVWSSADVEPLRGLNAYSALLVTTRESDTLPVGTKRVEVDAMAVSEAVKLLHAGLPDGEIAPFQSLARRLGEWALLLTLVNRQLREMVEQDGFTVKEALYEVNIALKAEGFAAFDRGSSEARDAAVDRTLTVSLRRLEETELIRYRQLAVFPEDTEIPLSILERFWGTSHINTVKLCKRLYDLSLLLRFDRREGTLRLHDVVRDYLIRQQPEKLRMLHQRLLDATSPADHRWADLPTEETYLWKNLAYHLLEAGKKEVFRELLLDLSYLQAKLQCTDINSLLADYEVLVNEERELLLIQGCLRLAAHILAKDRNQLPSQLLGRLLGSDTPTITRLLNQCVGWKNFICLKPRTLSLIPPGGPLIRTLEGHTDWVTALALVDHRYAISGSYDGTLRVWDLENGETLKILGGYNAWVSVVAVLESRLAISGYVDGTMRVWDLDTGQILRNIKRHSGRVSALAIMDRQLVVSGSVDGTLRLWDLETGKILNTLPTSRISTLTILDSCRIIAGLHDGKLQIYNFENGQILKTLEGHTGLIRSVAIMDNKRIVSSSTDGSLRIWDLESGQTLKTLQGGGWGATALVDHRHVICSSANGTLRILDLEDGQTLRTLGGHTDWVRAVAIKGQRAFSVSNDRTFRVWDLETNQPTQTLQEHTDSVWAIAIVSGRRAISGSNDRTLRIWDLKSAQIIRTVEGHIPWGRAVAVIDGHHAVSGSSDETLRVWDLDTEQTLRTLKGHTKRILTVAVVDSQRAISGSEDRTLRLWDLKTGQTLQIFKGHFSGIRAVAAVDSRQAISGSDDRRLHLWDLATGRILRTFQGHTDLIWAVAVVDKRRAISSSDDRMLRTWELAGPYKFLKGILIGYRRWQ